MPIARCGRVTTPCALQVSSNAIHFNVNTEDVPWALLYWFPDDGDFSTFKYHYQGSPDQNEATKDQWKNVPSFPLPKDWTPEYDVHVKPGGHDFMKKTKEDTSFKNRFSGAWRKLTDP